MSQPKSTEQLKQDGNYRPDRHGNRSDHLVEKIVETPKAPTYLDKYGKRKFKDLCQKYIDLEILTILDIETIEIIAQYYSMYKQCFDSVYYTYSTDPETGRTKKRKRSLVDYLVGKNSQTSPELIQLNKALEQYQKLLKAFGSTPTDRTRIHFPVKEQPEEKQGLQKLIS